MTKKITYLLLIAGTLFFSSCQKNIDVFVPNGTTGPDTTWYATVTSSMPLASLQTNLLIEPVRDSVEISSSINTYLTTVSGIQCGFPPLCCVNTAGTPVTGRIQVELFVIRKKGDMVLMNKPTTSNGNMLVSAGEIFIRLKKDGQDITLAPGARITIRYSDLPVNSSMKLFFGEETSNGLFNWLPNNDTLLNTVGYAQQVYEITTNHLRWINLDYLYDTAGIVRSTVSVRLPSNYTNANTTAFLVFKDLRSVIRMNADLTEKRFITSKVPAGKGAYIVVISKQANDYFMAKESITTGVNVTPGGNQPFSLTPVKTTLADIKTWLATL
ncbi:MAG: hypothetical protein U0V75_02960 [Ferruginibacter sp.]